MECFGALYNISRYAATTQSEYISHGKSSVWCDFQCGKRTGWSNDCFIKLVDRSCGHEGFMPDTAFFCAFDFSYDT